MASSFDDATRLFNFVVKDGNGIKGLVDLGLTEVPKPYIQPPEQRIDKSTRPLEQPPIDMSLLDGPERDQVTQQIVRAAETLGFFQVVNHGVPVELLKSLKDAAYSFFRQPSKKKAVYLKGASLTPLVKYATSFNPEKEKALEWKDYLSMKYTNDVDALQYWPIECRKVSVEYLKESTKLVRKLLDILIGNLGVTLDDQRINALSGRKAVNMNFYPPCPNPDLTVGIAGHTDMGLLTVLLQDEISGLHIKVDDEFDLRRKGEWLEIPPLPGALVINLGDTLQILSNGRYKSVEHAARTTSVSSRVSIPAFTSPAPTEKIAPLPEVVAKDGIARYREVLFADYMKNFFENALSDRKSIEFAGIKM